MTMVTVADVLDDPALRAAVLDDLAEALDRAWRDADSSGRDSRIHRNGYDVVVSRHGDIEVEIITFGGFDTWVQEAGELALHVGPSHDPQTGRAVTDILGVDENGDPVEARPGDPAAGDDDGDPDTSRWTPGGPALHWPEWSGRLVAAKGEEAPDITVSTGSVTWAFRCDSCGMASSDGGDFTATASPETRRCECGADAVRTPAVYCDDCDTLILLRSTDPAAPA
jgi:hypothetical protein